MEELNVATMTKKNDLYNSPKHPEQVEKEVSSGDKKFLSIIAHDIKTPMGSVIGFLDLVKVGMDKWDRDKLDKYIELALISAKRTYTLLNSLLEWANADNIFKSFQPEILDLNKILKEEILDTEIVTLQKQIKINQLVLSGETVFADKNMVKSILRNLITNAIKYSHKLGKIDVSSKKDEGFLEITIKDYGVGIDFKTARSIFSSNNYISTLGTMSEPGTGYGLLLCKELIEINKGRIWIVENADGGSEFRFTLPLNSQSVK